MDYKNGKIYRLVCGLNTFYVGSTTQSLAKRVYCHKQDYKAGKCPHRYTMVDDWNNVEIILVEFYPCDSKDELYKRERYWIEELKPCGNKQIPCRTMEEWYQENREKELERQKKYREANTEKILKWREANKDKIKEHDKRYREANKEVVNQKNRDYYEANKEIINAKRRERYAEKKLDADSKDDFEAQRDTAIKQQEV